MKNTTPEHISHRAAELIKTLSIINVTLMHNDQRDTSWFMVKVKNSLNPTYPEIKIDMQEERRTDDNLPVFYEADWQIHSTSMLQVCAESIAWTEDYMESCKESSNTEEDSTPPWN